MQAAPSWQSKAEVFEQRYQQKLQSFLTQANQLLSEMTQVRDEAVHVLSQVKQAEGKDSIASFCCRLAGAIQA